MLRSLTTFLSFALAATASLAAAQVEVVEEGQVSETQIVERGYVRGQGRGIQYGANLISPVHLTDVRSAMGGFQMNLGPGLGIWARVGWEFPSGFTIEVFGGLAGNGVDTGGTDASQAFLRADVAIGARYLFFNDTAFVPFIHIGFGPRWYWFDWTVPGRPMPAGNVNAEINVALHGGIGAQIELTPFLGIEAGLLVDYTFGFNTFSSEGFVSLTPFLGVTLYAYDETGN
jgi:hypothetical protein